MTKIGPSETPPAADGHVTIATLNTLGLPIHDPRLAARYRAITRVFESWKADVITFQEVFTYRHLRLLTRGLPSYRVSYQPSLLGPAGGLATFSRHRVTRRRYRRFPVPSPAPTLPRLARVKAALKGSLVTDFGDGLRVINTHPMANSDGDWSATSRFHRLQQEQLTALAGLIRESAAPVIVCGDFNVARDSTLFREFVARADVADMFKGQCPPTFHTQYLGPGQAAHCIDFILGTRTVEPEATETMFTDTVPLPGRPLHVSDHIGLRARLVLTG